ncbi:MAG TPA: hypothetical protein DCM64_07650 [Gammaproteobacteria bacterium]|jgi:putative iron-regulated protein|nr:imelysin family protein [Gammaproteobacteria bacterium]MDP6732389.1 imelysin family protein [Gammaproteobacteria bacterium]HAJ76315.1 hypothetical protein [Gammaproteobacteria bacterium]
MAPDFRLVLAVPLLAVAVLSACGSENEPLDQQSPPAISVNAARLASVDPGLIEPIQGVMRAYLQQMETDYDAVADNLDSLQSEILAFLEEPSTTSMNNVRSAWLLSHSAYELTTLHRYFADLILSEAEVLNLFSLRYRMNHWPILPGYIDYVAGFADSGIVQDTTVALNIPALQEQHGLFGLSEVSLGFHVIEFLIWGENPDQITPRSAADYQPDTRLTPAQAESGLELDLLSNNRRRQLLLLNAQSLIDDFSTSRTLWLTGRDRFVNSLSGFGSSELLALLIEAMTGMLTEEMLVRSLYPLLNEEYIDSIQSPFSHSTQNAVSAQLTSVEQLLLDTGATLGSSLDSILISLSSDFEELFYQNFDASKECLVLLYSTLGSPEDTRDSLRAEFEIVECINLLTNMIDHLEQIKVGLYDPV